MRRWVSLFQRQGNFGDGKFYKLVQQLARHLSTTRNLANTAALVSLLRLTPLALQPKPELISGAVDPPTASVQHMSIGHGGVLRRHTHA